MKEISKVKTYLEKNIESLTSEFNILKKINYPLITNLYFSYQDKEYIFLILDYLSGGTLRSHIPETPPPNPLFSEPQIKFLISNIILSLEYIHNKGIIHRDLKPENLLFDEEGYLHLLKKADGNILTKRRYLIPLEDGHTAELDIFHGIKEGLIMAEVEFASEKEAEEFVVPEWFAKEVTYDSNYHNSNMINEK